MILYIPAKKECGGCQVDRTDVMLNQAPSAAGRGLVRSGWTTWCFGVILVLMFYLIKHRQVEGAEHL